MSINWVKVQSVVVQLAAIVAAIQGSTDVMGVLPGVVRVVLVIAGTVLIAIEQVFRLIQSTTVTIENTPTATPANITGVGAVSLGMITRTIRISRS